VRVGACGCAYILRLCLCCTKRRTVDEQMEDRVRGTNLFLFSSQVPLRRCIKGGNEESRSCVGVAWRGKGADPGFEEQLAFFAFLCVVFSVSVSLSFSFSFSLIP
jgi:hypothetical protein